MCNELIHYINGINYKYINVQNYIKCIIINVSVDRILKLSLQFDLKIKYKKNQNYQINQCNDRRDAPL